MFEGVISGGEVAGWLIRSDGSQEHQYQHARDRSEACTIGQELLSCGLLLSVSCGFDEEDVKDHRYDDADSEGEDEDDNDNIGLTSEQVKKDNTKGSPKREKPGSSTQVAEKKFFPSFSTKETLQQNLVFLPVLPFSDMPGYIYRFPGNSSTGNSVGICTILGARICVKIPMLTLSDENEDSTPSRETTGFAIMNQGIISTIQETDLETIGDDDGMNSIESGGGKKTLTPAVTSSTGHVKYLLDISHGEDKWQTWKRFVVHQITCLLR